MSSLRVYIGTNEIQNGEYISRSQAREPLTLDWNPNDNTLYTLVISNPTYDEIVGQYSNIRGNQILPDNVVIPYNIDPYLYLDHDTEILIDLYQQYGYIDPSDFLFEDLIPIASLTFWIDPPVQDRFMPNVDISDAQKKYCGCIIDTASNEPESCLIDKAWYQRVDNHSCANPYAVCGKLPHESNECFLYYDYAKLSDAELRALSILQKMPLPQNISRDELIQRFENKRNNKPKF